MLPAELTWWKDFGELEISELALNYIQVLGKQ